MPSSHRRFQHHVSKNLYIGIKIHLLFCLSTYLSIWLFINPSFLSMYSSSLSNYLSITNFKSVYLSVSIHLSVYLLVYLFVYSPIYLYVYSFTCLSVNWSIYLSVIYLFICIAIFVYIYLLSFYLHLKNLKHFCLSVYIFVCIYLSSSICICLSIYPYICISIFYIFQYRNMCSYCIY